MKTGKAEILEKRICEDSSNDYIYYVHYEGCKYYYLFITFSFLSPNNPNKQHKPT